MNRIIFTLLAISASIGSPLMAQTRGSTTTSTLTQDQIIAQKNAFTSIMTVLNSLGAAYRIKNNSQSINPAFQNIQTYASNLNQNYDENSMNSLMQLQHIILTTTKQLSTGTQNTVKDKAIFAYLTNLDANLKNAPTTLEGLKKAELTSNMTIIPQSDKSILNRNSNAHLDFTK